MTGPIHGSEHCERAHRHGAGASPDIMIEISGTGCVPPAPTADGVNVVSVLDRLERLLRVAPTASMT
jgi:hypothetical protein